MRKNIKKLKLKLKPFKKRTKRYKGKFNSDIDWKRLFKNLSSQKVIRIINELFSTDFDVNSKLEFIDTESSIVTGYEGKGLVRSDLVLKIFNESNKEDVDKIIIEFQSTSNKNMGYRMFIYSLNHSRVIEIGNEIYCEPAQCITIYTTFDKKLAGVDEVKIKQYDYEQVGMFKFKLVDNDNYIVIKYPFINLLPMLQEDLQKLDNTELDIFKVLYLYRYKKKKELLLKEDINLVINQAKLILDKYENEELEILVEIFHKLISDIEAVLKINKPQNEKYGKVLENMLATRDGVTVEKMREIRAEGRAEGLAERIDELAKEKAKLAKEKAKVAKEKAKTKAAEEKAANEREKAANEREKAANEREKAANEREKAEETKAKLAELEAKLAMLMKEQEKNN